MTMACAVTGVNHCATLHRCVRVAMTTACAVTGVNHCAQDMTVTCCQQSMNYE